MGYRPPRARQGRAQTEELLYVRDGGRGRRPRRGKRLWGPTSTPDAKRNGSRVLALTSPRASCPEIHVCRAMATSGVRQFFARKQSGGRRRTAGKQRDPKMEARREAIVDQISLKQSLD
ncbi:unnamed protein product [Heligmosomoides polygyrus]|uniref:Uncharacterized protein n=1 Tax=Heligmosomoides polygyrus TaxID=6339 RepID=A0A183GIC7_HELPZ|nr:unnamed protein product [Heligmosomoides polygyrus]